MKTWTDDWIEKLRSLWAEGLSASQIAVELGGVSRNAVIGKVHRLKLPQRKTTTASVRRSAQTPSVATSARPSVARVTPAISRGGGVIAHKPKVQPAVPQPDAEVVPIFPRITLMDLGTSTCRWPIGDPTSSDFRFCGAKTESGAPYCTYHACMAYQPRNSRDRQRRSGNWR